jgi:hypothetical protein
MSAAGATAQPTYFANPAADARRDRAMLEPMVARCAWCDWTAEGLAQEILRPQHEHRFACAARPAHLGPPPGSLLAPALAYGKDARGRKSTYTPQQDAEILAKREPDKVLAAKWQRTPVQVAVRRAYLKKMQRRAQAAAA